MAKPTIKVNREQLKAAFVTAELGGALKNHAALWVAVAEIYNKTADTKISPAVAMLRAGEWEIPYITVAGKKGRAKGSGGTGKPSVVVDQAALEAAIKLAEFHGALPNLSVLWAKTAENYNEKADTKISPAVAMLRAGEWEIPHVTVSGRPDKLGNRKSSGIAVIARFGDTPKGKLVLAADKYNYIVGFENNETVTDRKYSSWLGGTGAFQTLERIMGEQGLKYNADEVGDIICAAMNKLTGQNYKISRNDALPPARQIEKAFNCHFVHNENTYKDLFHVEAEEAAVDDVGAETAVAEEESEA